MLLMKQKIPKSSATVKFHISHDQGPRNQSNLFCNNNKGNNDSNDTVHNCCSIYNIKIANNLIISLSHLVLTHF